MRREKDGGEGRRAPSPTWSLCALLVGGGILATVLGYDLGDDAARQSRDAIACDALTDTVFVVRRR